uniref:Uncharacterized protein n=1 Tax=Panagrolaimus sp. PS1159 TaxID=55785 RepID=A0AC35FZ16_9BILA
MLNRNRLKNDCFYENYLKGVKSIFFILLFRLQFVNGFIRTNRCYSCMSAGYEDLFKEGHLSKYFYEPKNFTSQCDYPMDVTDVGFIQCRTICLTLIQDLMVMGRPTGKKLTMRGCSTSLNKYGFVNRTMNIFDRYDMCREVKMTDLFNYETDSQIVTVCR